MPQVWGRVPPRNRNFTGRHEVLAQLHDGFATDSHPGPQVLCGMGGVGKTQISIEYAHRYANAYDLVWWIPADQPALVSSALAGLAPHLGMASAAVTGIDEAAEAVREVLRRGDPYEHWLLVYDNVDNPEEISVVLPAGSGDVLITSRNQRWRSVAQTISVDVFTPAESAEFLHRRAPGMTDSEATGLAEVLGGLPLAMEQAGALQAETGMSATDFMDLLSRHPGELLSESRPLEYPMSMTAMWSLAISRLEGSLPEAAALLSVLAFFGPERIPRSVLSAIPSDSAAPSLVTHLRNPIGLARTIRELGRLSLAVIEDGGRSLRVHRLVQLLMRDSLYSDAQDERRHLVHAMLAAAMPDDPGDTSGWPEYAALHPHLIASDIHTCGSREVRRSVITMASYLNASGAYVAAVDLALRCSRSWQDSGNELDAALMNARLAAAMRARGDHGEADRMSRSALDTIRGHLGEDHSESIAAAIEHASGLRTVGNFAAARLLDEETIEHSRVREDSGVWAASHGLALDHLLLGEYRTARRIVDELPEPPSEPAELQSRVTTAMTLRFSGQESDAVGVCRDAYDRSVSLLGGSHPLSLRAGRELSVGLRQVHSGIEACELARMILEECRSCFGTGHPDSLGAALSLANAYRATGDHTQALELAEETYRRCPSGYGAEHPSTYACMADLALIQRHCGDIESAGDLTERALAGFRGTLGTDHPDTLACVVDLASVLAERGDGSSACHLGRDAFKALRRTVGPAHPRALAAAANLVVDLRSMGEDAEAQRILAEFRVDHPARIDLDFDPIPA